MRKFMFAALVTLGIVGALSSAAHAETAPTLTELQQLQAEVSKGLTPTVRPEVINFVHDSTRDLALKRNCARDRFGNPLAPNGEWEDAHWYGKANPEKTGLDSPEAQKEKYKYRAKLSWKSGYCYLTTNKTGGTPWPSSARRGAESRVKAAIKRIG